MTADSPETHVLRLVRDARKRLRRTRAVRALTIAAPLAVAGVALAAWVRAAEPWPLVAVGTAMPMIMAMVAALRTPANGVVAEILDTRLRLADRTSAAVQMASRTDVMARAIVRDAAAKLTPSSIATVLPYQAHPRAAAAWVLAVVSVVLWASVPSRDAGVATRSSPGGAGKTRAAAGASAENARGSGQSPAVRSDGAGPSGPADRSGRAADDVASEQSPDASANPPAERAARGEAAGSRGSAGRSNGRDLAARTGARGDQAARGAARDGAPRGASAESGVRPAAAGTAGITAGRGGAAPADGRLRSGAGGVQRGQLAANQAGTPTTSASRQVSSAAIAAAQGRADAAIAHDTVPPSRRAYLRDYYRAVGAMSQK
jgi:hypothetical protein